MSTSINTIYGPASTVYIPVSVTTNTSATATTTVWTGKAVTVWTSDTVATQSSVVQSTFLYPGRFYKLPDGSTLTVDYDGNYVIEDQDAKVIYKANRIREFNPYVNVSDILERFMEYASKMKLTKEQFIGMPIRTFLMWLVIEAAKHDGDDVPEQEVRQLELALETNQ